MPFVGRNLLGEIAIEHATLEVGVAEEFLADDNAELLAWRGQTGDDHRTDEDKDQRAERDRLNTLPDTAPVQIGDLKKLGWLG